MPTAIDEYAPSAFTVDSVVVVALVQAMLAQCATARSDVEPLYYEITPRPSVPIPIEVDDAPAADPVIVDVDDAVHAMLVQCVTRRTLEVELTETISG